MDSKVQSYVREYTLTKKEGKVLDHLLNGLNAKEIASSECITYESARWYIKQIYQKVGVSSQVKLMHKLLVES